jgi:hypothetical protein
VALVRATRLVLLIGLAFALAPSAQASAACVVSKSTAYDNPAEGNGATSVYSGQQVAQSFKVPSTTPLHHVSIYAANIGATDDAINVELRTDTAGKPGDVIASRSRVLANTTLAFADFDFTSSNLTLTAGTTYYLVATNTAAAQLDGYTWESDGTGATYPDGSFYFSTSGGAMWVNNTSFDQLFQVWGQACVADQQPDTVKPTIQAVALGSKTFRAASSGGSVARKLHPVGTKVSFKLSEAASVRFTVERKLKGRKKGKKCVAPTKKNRKKKRCTRYKKLKGSFTRTGQPGANSFRFTGRLRGKKLAPGSYRLVSVATDAANNKSKPKRATFRIVRR